LANSIIIDSMRLLLFLLALPAVYAQNATVDGATRADWPHYGGTQLSWRYSALDQINTANVKNLVPAWIFQTGDYAENLQATPIVMDGVMYVITPRAQVSALDAATGRLIWQYRYPPNQSGPLRNSGVAVSDGKVFFGTRDNYLVALDQNTGRELWKTNVDDRKQCNCSISAAPLVVKDKVIVGGNGGDRAERGYLTAFYARTGRLAWRWYVIPGPGEKGNETWKGDSWRFGGGSPWMTGSFDAGLNLVYWGTGNAAADFYDADRVVAGADKVRDVNLYTASVVALDADTGKLRWHYQEVPDDNWDYDSAYEVILMDREIRGRMRNILVHMNKSGLTFVLDRASGEFLGVFSVPEVRNWITGVTEDGKLVGRNEPKLGKTETFCPSVYGAKSWNSMAYSPRTGFLYTPTNELCNDATANDTKPVEGAAMMNAALKSQAAAQSRYLRSRGRLGSGDRQAHVELPVQIRSGGLHAGHRWRSGVHRRSGREFFCIGRAHRRQALEFSDRRRPSRISDLIFGEWAAVCRHADRLAGDDFRKCGCGVVSRCIFPPGLNFGGIRVAGRIDVAGGIEMTRALFLLAVGVVASAQNLPDLLKQGERCSAGGARRVTVMG